MFRARSYLELNISKITNSQMTKTQAQKHLIVAIDSPNLTDVLKIATNLKDQVAAIKLGLEFFVANGPEGIKKVKKTGCPIFLDLKFHDISNTVAKAVKESVKLGVEMLTIHTSGGENMMKAAIKSAKETALQHSIKTPLILGVTILTSLDKQEISDIGYSLPLIKQVQKLASLAKKSGLSGIVCSPHESKILKTSNPSLKLITPGVRFADDEAGDQKRIMTPHEAIKNGSDFLVMGRSILKGNPLEKINKFNKCL
jgi:orotidine-5'-phosphate decarboxylase